MLEGINQVRAATVLATSLPSDLLSQAAKARQVAFCPVRCISAPPCVCCSLWPYIRCGLAPWTPLLGSTLASLLQWSTTVNILKGI